MSNEKKKIRKKLLGFDVGMTYYSTLEEDEEDITIPFVESLYITSNKIVELLPEYLECLKRNECPEVLGIDLDVMTNTAYWMKNDKLAHDMEALNDLTLHERGIEFAYKGFKPATTLELYQAIRKNVEDMVRMLADVRRLLIAAPPALYGNFFRQQKSQYDEQKAVAAYEQWKREVGVVTFDILVDKQALEVAEFLKRKILRFSQMPSKREIDRVDINKLKEHLPIGYELPEEFPKCYARFMRFATLDGDILRINANSYGKYLHQFYHRLSDDEQQVLIGLDLMLQLIHRDMQALMAKGKKGEMEEEEEMKEECEKLLVNDIFSDELFTSNQQLLQLQTIISQSVGMGNQEKIDLSKGMEWYWLYQAIYDAGMFETCNNRENVVTVVGFVRQIAKWLPDIIDIDDEERIRNICKSMSAEQGNWMMNGKPVSLVDIEANKRRMTAMKPAKIERIICVAYNGLYTKLLALKQEI